MTLYYQVYLPKCDTWLLWQRIYFIKIPFDTFTWIFYKPHNISFLRIYGRNCPSEWYRFN